MEHVRAWIELAVIGIETLAVAIMVGLIAIATVRWLFHTAHTGQLGEQAYERYRVGVGKSLLLGLELLIAADIVRTVALDLSPYNVATLAALILVRTFLGWTLSLEVDGCWPWQKGRPVAEHQRTDAIRAGNHENTT